MTGKNQYDLGRLTCKLSVLGRVEEESDRSFCTGEVCVSSNRNILSSCVVRSKLDIIGPQSNSSLQVELWKKFIQWEKGNPMDTEEYGAFARRGMR